MTLVKLTIPAFAGLLLALPVTAQDTIATQTNEAAQEAAKSAPMIIAQVNGLVCDFCAQALKKVFNKEQGDAVKDLTIDLDKGHVLIAMNPGQTLSDDVVKDLIRKSGYSLVGIERAGGA